MLKIDDEKMIIAMTRGDTANIVFSAVDAQGVTYEPVVGDILWFSVAKKVGADPFITLMNEITNENVKYKTVYDKADITEEEFVADPTHFYTENDGVYTQCQVGDTFGRYIEVEVTEDEFDVDPTNYYTESGGAYTQCEEGDTFDPAETYYIYEEVTYYTARTIVDADDFWTITIGAAGSYDWYQKDSNGNVVIENGRPALIKFGDYAFDVQLTHGGEIDTIIGATDEIEPTFKVWGEVVQE